MLTRLMLVNWKGITAMDVIPPRLVLSGPNESGKTARLEAVRYALRLPASKAGLAPFMSGDSCEIGVGSDRGAVYRACRRVSDSSFKTTSRFEPSLGEKSEAAVNARVASEFRVDPFLLDVEAWLSDTAGNRRRALMGLLAPMADQLTVEHARLEVEKKLGENPELQQLLAALGKNPTTSALEWLRMVEEAAKARVSALGQQVDAAQAQLRTAEGPEAPSSGKSSAQLREECEALDVKIEAAVRSGQEPATIARRIKDLRERLAADRAMVDKWDALKGKRGEELREAHAAELDQRTEHAQKASFAASRSAAALGPWKHACNEAARNVSDAEGRLHAFEGLRDRLRGMSNDKECPVCGGSTGSISGNFEQRIEIARREVDRLAGILVELRGDKAIEAAYTKALEEQSNTGRALRSFHDAGTFADRLIDAEDRIAALEETLERTAPPVSQEEIDGLRASRGALRAELDLVTRAEERRRSLSQLSKRLDDALLSVEHAKAVVRECGQAGIAGRFLELMVQPLTAALAKALPGRKPGIRLFDERGGPDAIPTLDGVPFAALSGGARASVLAAFAGAVATFRSGHDAILLVEAGEIDHERLGQLLAALGHLPVANIIVATHIQVAPDLPGGFSVQYLGDYPR